MSFAAKKFCDADAPPAAASALTPCDGSPRQPNISRRAGSYGTVRRSPGSASESLPPAAVHHPAVEADPPAHYQQQSRHARCATRVGGTTIPGAIWPPASGPQGRACQACQRQDRAPRKRRLRNPQHLRLLHLDANARAQRPPVHQQPGESGVYGRAGPFVFGRRAQRPGEEGWLSLVLRGGGGLLSLDALARRVLAAAGARP
eukprot:1672934-Prymnesium_polylepis.1